VQVVVDVRQAGVGVRSSVASGSDGEFDAGYAIGSMDHAVISKVFSGDGNVRQLVGRPEILGTPNPFDLTILDGDDVVKDSKFVVFDDVMESQVVASAAFVFGWAQLRTRSLDVLVDDLFERRFVAPRHV